MRKRCMIGVGLIVALGSAACSSDSGGTSTTPEPDPPLATSLAVSPTSGSLEALGATLQLSAQVADQYGNAMPSAAVSWASGNNSVVTVSATGLVTAVGPGSTTVSATSADLSGSVQISVTQTPASVEVTPASADIVGIGETLQLTATVLDSNDNIIENAQVVWETGNAAVATVSATGLVTSVASGRADIQASNGGISGRAEVSVELRPIADVTVYGYSRIKVAKVYEFEIEPKLADGTVVPERAYLQFADTTMGLVGSGTLVAALKSGSLTLQVIVDEELWSEIDVTGYDWGVSQSSTLNALVLESAIEITNNFGESQYSELVVGCGQLTGNFYVWMDNSHIITADGQIAYKFGEDGRTISDTWLEEEGFTRLLHPGYAGTSSYSFAVAAGEVDLMGIGFTEFPSTVHAAVFEPTLLDLALTQTDLFNGCTPGTRQVGPVQAAPADVATELMEGERLDFDPQAALMTRWTNVRQLLDFEARATVRSELLPPEKLRGTRY